MDIFSTIFGNLEQILGLKMALSNHWNGLKNQDFGIFHISSTFWQPVVLFGSLVGYWDLPRCFPMFVGVFQAFRGVKNDLD